VPIDAGFDCPNRDGTVAHGGCTFCSVSGSGDMIVAPEEPIPVQVEKEIEFLHQKWPGVKKYIAYFQNFTNTHGPVEVLRERLNKQWIDQILSALILGRVRIVCLMMCLIICLNLMSG
jgi:radical SAM superfamily enzyme